MIRRRTGFWVLWVVLFAWRAWAAEPLFVIDRSLNRNQVVYELNLSDANGMAENPVRVYWVLHEDNGRVEELSSLEQGFVYGVSIRKQEAEELRFVLKALPKKEIVVLRRKGGGFVAVTEIAGHPAFIKSIFIKSIGSGIFSSVRYVEVNGLSVDGEERVVERIVPKRAFG